jgi:hypothetical protein
MLLGKLCLKDRGEQESNHRAIASEAVMKVTRD